MSRSVFSTPIVTPVLQILAAIVLKLSGWKITPAPFPKPPFIFIAAPHTSNWDFLLLMLSAFVLKIDLKWMGKHTLFNFPCKHLMLWFGGIPVNRTSPQNIVANTVATIKENPSMVICIPPEGTRKKVTAWKTGFYHIAHQAQMPVYITAIDGKNKTLLLLGEFMPTGDAEKDIKEIQQHYLGIEGIRAENTYDFSD